MNNALPDISRHPDFLLAQHHYENMFPAESEEDDLTLDDKIELLQRSINEEAYQQFCTGVGEAVLADYYNDIKSATPFSVVESLVDRKLESLK